MAIVNGYFDWAELEEAPIGRINYLSDGQPITVDMMTHHSQEGWYSTYKTQYIPERFPTAPTGVVMQSGELIQICPYNIPTVHSNFGNYRGPGYEADGTNKYMLTPQQIDTYLRIHAELRNVTGRQLLRWTGKYGDFPPEEPDILWLTEHKQTGLTECPSDRYIELWELYNTEESMNPEQVAKLNAVYNALCAGDSGIINNWNANGNSLLLGYNRLFALTTKVAEKVGVSFDG